MEDLACYQDRQKDEDATPLLLTHHADKLQRNKKKKLSETVKRRFGSVTAAGSNTPTFREPPTAGAEGRPLPLYCNRTLGGAFCWNNLFIWFLNMSTLTINLTYKMTKMRVLVSDVCWRVMRTRTSSEQMYGHTGGSHFPSGNMSPEKSRSVFMV